LFLLTILASILPGAAFAASAVEDAAPPLPFAPGDTIEFSDLDRLRDYIPEPFWENREYYFFEGMTLAIGEFYKEYPISAERKAVNEDPQYRGKARIGRDDSLENYTLGRPFPEIDPADPQAGVKHAWNMDYKHDALEGEASFYFRYFDNGEALPVWAEGTGWGLRLSHRSDRAAEGGRVFKKEKRKGAGGVEIKGPADLRGILLLGYAYNNSDAPRDEARDVDIWVYVPDLRRVRRISGSRRTDPVLGTDMTSEDGQGFQGVITHYDWEYKGEVDLLSPIDTRLKGYPIGKDENFGPYGFSFGNDIWQLRKAIVLEMRPKDEDHIYRRKTLWLDKDTYQPLYAAAYDRRDEVWKLMMMAHKWSQRSDLHEPIPGVNAFLPAAFVLSNVVTGTGVRIEVFDVRPTRMSRGRIRKKIDIGRLSRQGR
jgi:hypothetical protein